jgi:hypothetical protein
MNNLSINPIIDWRLAVICVAFLLLIILWLEVIRKERWLTLRLLAVGCLMAGITGILLQPATLTTTTGSLLLTPNFNKRIVDSLINNNTYSIFSLPGTQVYRSSNTLKSYRDINELEEPVVIVGEGVPVSFIPYLKEKATSFLATRTPEGTVSIIDENYLPNRLQKIKGTLNNNGGIKKVILVGPGGKEDSVLVSSTGFHEFSLSFYPKLSGPFLYQCIIESDAEKQTYNLPVIIKEEESLSILMLADYPTAELRFLKNYLAQKNHQLAIRYQISQNRFQTEFVNRAITNLDGITPTLLSQVDLIITNNQTYSSLSQRESQTLTEAIKNGLGVLLIADELPSRNKFFTSYLSVGKRDTTRIPLLSGNLTVTTSPVQFQKGLNLYAITKNINDKPLSGYAYLGLGKLGFQTITNSYSLFLEGKPEEYALLWTELIEKTAREKNIPFKIKIESPFPLYTGEPIDISVLAANDKPELWLDSTRVPLSENTFIDNVWHGTIRGQKNGWQTLIIANDSTQLPFYISPEDEWRAMQITNQMQALKVESQSGENAVQHRSKKPITPVIFYLLFIVGSGALWLSPKL